MIGFMGITNHWSPLQDMEPFALEIEGDGDKEVVIDAMGDAEEFLDITKTTSYLL